MTTILDTTDDDDGHCRHLWIWVDHLNAFVCKRCHEIDDAA